MNMPEEGLHPPTPEGIRGAIDETEAMGWWEARVDWGQDVEELYSPQQAIAMALLALAETAALTPELFDPQMLDEIAKRMTQFGSAGTVAFLRIGVDV